MGHRKPFVPSLFALSIVSFSSLSVPLRRVALRCSAQNTRKGKREREKEEDVKSKQTSETSSVCGGRARFDQHRCLFLFSSSSSPPPSFTPATSVCRPLVFFPLFLCLSFDLHFFFLLIITVLSSLRVVIAEWLSPASAFIHIPSSTSSCTTSFFSPLSSHRTISPLRVAFRSLARPFCCSFLACAWLLLRS